MFETIFMQRYYLCTIQTIGENTVFEKKIKKSANSAIVVGAIAFTKVPVYLSQTDDYLFSREVKTFPLRSSQLELGKR